MHKTNVSIAYVRISTLKVSIVKFCAQVSKPCLVLISEAVGCPTSVYACSCTALFLKWSYFFLFQGKALIRPIAFRPTPGPNSGASTPTNGPLMGFRPPSNGPDSLHGLARASPATSQGGPFTPGTNTNDGFAPGHPLVKDGRRHYGSKNFVIAVSQDF